MLRRGQGYIAEAFARAAGEVIGVDLTAAMVAIGEERTKQNGLSNVSFRMGDAQNLLFERESFDVVAADWRCTTCRTPDESWAR